MGLFSGDCRDLLVYPKVKVRDGDHGSSDGDGQRSPLMGLKAIDFLSIIDFNSQSHPRPGQEHQVFPERRARFDNCRVENVAPPTISALEGKLDVGLDEATKQNVRASPVPRPRAVLSSPSNDVMIGKKNKKLAEKTPVSRNTPMCQQPPANAHQKTAAKASSYRSPKNAKIPRETANEKSARTQKGANESAASEASQKMRLHVKNENFFRV